MIDVIERKFSFLLSKLFEIITIGQILIVKNPTKKQVKSVEKLLPKNDAPILASALKENVNYLVTLDNDFIKKEVVDFAFKNKILILKPRDFIKLLMA
ncbi:MAG: hypothetical protein KatS3mg095_0440 [Candidatus Parcubacteria bacterium]|nr:MAG: hypothetical protein KatS3mg095_0440 [Candidatus Parcubacteria bacterium]